MKNFRIPDFINKKLTLGKKGSFFFCSLWLKPKDYKRKNKKNAELSEYSYSYCVYFSFFARMNGAGKTTVQVCVIRLFTELKRNRQRGGSQDYCCDSQGYYCCGSKCDNSARCCSMNHRDSCDANFM